MSEYIHEGNYLPHYSVTSHNIAVSITELTDKVMIVRHYIHGHLRNN
jgi:23S rRNA maturation-related 3'-5' exoribonuclease YhaM